jgi:hypothetical protein
MRICAAAVVAVVAGVGALAYLPSFHKTPPVVCDPIMGGTPNVPMPQ